MKNKYKGQSRSFIITHKQPGKFSIYCKCGYMGSAIDVKIEEEMMCAPFTANKIEGPTAVSYNTGSQLQDPVPVRAVYARTEQVCPMCEVAPEHSLDERLNYGISCIEFSKVWDNDHKSSLSIFFTEFYYNKQVGKIGSKRKNLRLTHNSDTGMSYLKYGPALRNITYMSGKAIPKSVYPILDMFQYKNNRDKKATERYLEWLDMCFEKRGIRFLKPKDMHDLQSCLAVLRFPIFESLPYRQIGRVPQPIRKQLLLCQKSNEAYKLLFGTNAKSIKKHFSNPLIASNMHYYQSVFTQTANLNKILNGIAGEPIPPQKYVTLLFDESLVEGLTGNYHEYSPVPARLEAMEFFKKLHVDETHFTNKVLNTLQERLSYTNGFGSERIKEYVFNFSHVQHLILDTHRLYTQILEYMPDYQLNYRGDIKRLHDDVSKDFSKVRHKNLVIPYKEAEVENFNKHIDDEYEFRLATDTHELIEVGTSMNICVGGYGQFAYNRETTIINLLKNGEYHTCLEVSANRYESNRLTLVQAKLVHNALPDKELAQLVADYCDDAGVFYHTNSGDLRALSSDEEHTDLPAPQIVGAMAQPYIVNDNEDLNF